MQRPSVTEHNPYFSRYIDLVPEGGFLELLSDNTVSLILLFDGIEEGKHNYAYDKGKWTIKQVLQHINDTERVMSYRALVALRGDSTTLLGSMDENSYADNADVSHKTMNDLLTEFMAIRTATTKMLEGIPDSISQRTALANGTATSARALGYIIIGHAQHHLNIIKQRYLQDSLTET